ncbi:MAG: ComEC/Rec2 family competence protein [Leptospiraceae bacterium]|nr:ComEC/Rec2 family competence protein [Leptospiraceae bacterium]MCP5498412.1 ComEC/Rec2 family competence protein [Leptospiraceae bacterium]
MKEFFLTFLPGSGFGYFCLGFFFSETLIRITSGYSNILFILFPQNLIPINSLFKTLLFFSVFILLFLLSRKNKLLSFLLGFLYCAFFIFYNQAEVKEKSLPYLNPEVLEKLQKQKAVFTISASEEVKKNYRQITLFSDKEAYKGVWRVYNKKRYQFPDLLCPAQSLKLKQSPFKGNEYFSFLDTYGTYYIRIYEYKCKALSNTYIDEKKKVRKEVENLLLRGNITDHALDISLGLIFGDAQYLEYELKEKARMGGILHLFAASGLHIGIIIGFLFLFTERSGLFGYTLTRLIPLALSFFYLYLLSFPVSLTRAYLFALIFVIASITYRRTHSSDTILFSAFVIYLFDPESYLTISFLLSFGAVCGILFFKKYLDLLFFKDKTNLITDNFTLSLSASLGTYPILIYFFHSFSAGSLLINLVLVPLTSLLLPFLYSSLAIESLSIFYLKDIFWSYTELFLRLLALLTDKLGENIGLYRENAENILLLLKLFALFLLFISSCIVLLLEFKKKNPENVNLQKDHKKSRIALSFLSFIATFLFYYATFDLLDKKNSVLTKLNGPDFSFHTDYILIKEKEGVYFGGNCKYNSFYLEKLINEGFCSNIKGYIEIEEESCLKQALLCKEKTGLKEKPVLLSKGNWRKEWENYETIQQSERKEIREFISHSGERIIFFYTHKDSLEKLLSRVKNGKGKIVLIFPYKSKDSIQDWQKYKSLLGIGKDWELIGKNAGESVSVL